jgi:hypothetical protein
MPLEIGGNQYIIDVFWILILFYLDTYLFTLVYVLLVIKNRFKFDFQKGVMPP